jgi:hypothetical protein
MVLLLVLLTGCTLHRSTHSQMIPVSERNGLGYVKASALELKAGIAVKSLPASESLAVCSAERCALIKEFVREDNEIWMSISALENALGLKAHFNNDRRLVSLSSVAQPTIAADSPRRVGQLAPNFRVARLDGSTVSLADFRGKRVLINSWASW